MSFPSQGAALFSEVKSKNLAIPSIEIKKPLPHEIQFITYAPCSPLSNLERELGERQRNPLQFGGWVGGEAKKSSPIWRMGWGRGQKCHLTKHQFFPNVAGQAFTLLNKKGFTFSKGETFKRRHKKKAPPCGGAFKIILHKVYLTTTFSIRRTLLPVNLMK